MIKPEQVLIIEPNNEIRFQGTFQQGITAYMKLTNPSTEYVYYKIKTTAPKKYCVRPNAGSLCPSESIQIAITPQPVCYDPNDKNKHKFMVQSVSVPEPKNIDVVWREINPEQLMDSKLKCVFENPPGAPTKETTESSRADSTTKRLGDDKAQEPLKQATENAAMEENASNVDVAKLIKESNKIRLENMILKEEVLRLRQTAPDTENQSASSSQRHTYDPPEMKSSITMISYIATAVSVAIFGILIGKYIM